MCYRHMRTDVSVVPLRMLVWFSKEQHIMCLFVDKEETLAIQLMWVVGQSVRLILCFLAVG